MEFVNVCLDHIRIQDYDGDRYDDYGDDDGEVIQGMRMLVEFVTVWGGLCRSDQINMQACMSLLTLPIKVLHLVHISKDAYLYVYESFATVGEIRVYWRADFQSGSRVLKKVF